MIKPVIKITLSKDDPRAKFWLEIHKRKQEFLKIMQTQPSKDPIEKVLQQKLRNVRGDQFDLPQQIKDAKEKLEILETRFKTNQETIDAILKAYPNISDPLKDMK